jgi:hypothetical protein
VIEILANGDAAFPRRFAKTFRSSREIPNIKQAVAPQVFSKLFFLGEFSGAWMLGPGALMYLYVSSVH